MQIRVINPDEVAAFAGVCTRAEAKASVQEYIERLIANGFSKSEWCFVAEDAGQYVGRVAYWTIPSIGGPQAIILLDVDWAGDFAAVGRELLAETARRLGITVETHLEYTLDSPPQAPQWQYFFDQRHDLLTAAGYEVIRNTLRFRLAGSAPVPEPGSRLVYTPLSETGEALFINTIQRVLAGSFDQRDQEDLIKFGLEQTAINFYNDLKTYDPNPDWWHLAYTQDGALIGLIVPSKIGSLYTIGYIGVVPEQRGHGYINDLLAKSTAILLAAGAPEIRTDTDQSNAPMANAFRRAGYEHFADRREYRLTDIAS